MLFHTDRKLLLSHLRPLSVLVFHLLLPHLCRGQSQLIGSSQPIVATLGDDIILPCHTKPEVDASVLTLEWTRPDLDPRFVLVWRSGQEIVSKKHKFFEGRTSLFVSELNVGNISLKLSKVRLSDEGTYRCFIPGLGIDSFVQLVVGSNAVSSAVITLEGIDKATSGVVLWCKSEGWYPEPEVLWLDSEGNLLPAGPTETVRGPDDLYTVSSRVTVKKRHSNNFTCRVQQKNINQTRETQIYIPDDFFQFQSSSSAITVGLAVGLAVCVLLVLLLVFFVWRQNRIKTKRSHSDESDEGKTSPSKSNTTKDQSVTKEKGEREPLKTDETVEMNVLMKDDANLKVQQSPEEQQRREEAENRMKIMKEELETKRNEFETKQAELQRLHDEKLRTEKELQNPKEELEKKNKELEGIRNSAVNHSFLGISSTMIYHSHRLEEQQRKEAENKAEGEVKTLKTKLETQNTELGTKIKEFDEKLPEVQRLLDVYREMEDNLQTQMEDLESNNKEVERIQPTPVRSSSSLCPMISRQKFQDEQQRREEAEDKVRMLKDKVQMQQTEIRELKRNQADTNMELLKETQKRQKAQREVDTLKNNSQTKSDEVKQLTEEKQRIEKERQNLQKQLQDASSKVSGTSSVSLNSTTGPVVGVEVDRGRKCIELINMSNKDQQLRGWKLKMRVNDKDPSIHKFENSLNLSPGYFVTIKSKKKYYDDLVFKDLQDLSSGDKLQVALISNTQEVQHLSVSQR